MDRICIPLFGSKLTKWEPSQDQVFEFLRLNHTPILWIIFVIRQCIDNRSEVLFNFKNAHIPSYFRRRYFPLQDAINLLKENTPAQWALYVAEKEGSY